MENTGVELLATLLKKTPEQLKEALANEESAAALKAEAESLMVYDTESFNSVLSNARRDYKDKAYGEIKGSVLEKYEKDLKKANGAEHLQAGVDYNNTIELNAKILELKSKIEQPATPEPTPTDDLTRKELEELRELVAQKDAEYKQKEKDLVNSHNNILFNNQLDGELNKFKALIDFKEEQKDGQLKFVKYEFQQRYEIQQKDGQTVVFDKQVNDIVKDGNLNYLPLSSVVESLVPQLVPIKEQVSVVGRGNNNQQLASNENSGRINWSAYNNSYDTYYDQVLKGKGIKLGSMEATEALIDFKTNVS